MTHRLAIILHVTDDDRRQTDASLSHKRDRTSAKNVGSEFDVSDGEFTAAGEISPAIALILDGSRHIAGTPRLGRHDHLNLPAGILRTITANTGVNALCAFRGLSNSAQFIRP